MISLTRHSIVSKAITKFTHPACTARINYVDSVLFVNRIRKMIKFERGKEIEKFVFRLVISMGQRKRQSL